MVCRRFLCNVCDMPNEVPVDYFAGLDQAGRRLDEAQRPELGQGSVEYVAPQEYMVCRWFLPNLKATRPVSMDRAHAHDPCFSGCGTLDTACLS